jgi:hypothetical protein
MMPVGTFTKSGLFAGGASAFIITVETTTANETIEFCVRDYDNAAIDWGDGQEEGSTTGLRVPHTYAVAGTYEITCFMEQGWHRGSEGGTTNGYKFREIKQWGNCKWTSLDDCFSNFRYLYYRASDVPDLSICTSLSSCFQACGFYTTPEAVDLSAWASEIEGFSGSMSSMFNGVKNWIMDMDSWGWHPTASSYANFVVNATGVTSLSETLGWVTSNCTYLSGMCQNSINARLKTADWDVSNIISFDAFAGRTLGVGFDTRTWTNATPVGGFTLFGGMVTKTDAIYCDLSKFNVTTAVTSLSSLAQSGTDFAVVQDVSGWDVSNVTSFQYLLGQ